MKKTDNILEFHQVHKRFPGVHALDDVSFSVKRGSVHGICGENGAGKSTLMKILSGVYPSDTYEGKVVFNGEELVLQSDAIYQSMSSGIGIVYQELALIPHMTVGENVFLGREPVHRGVIHWAQLYSHTNELFKDYHIDIHPQAKVGTLSVGKQQLVEIAKALSENAKLLIFDEPTSALSEQEIEKLMEIIGILREKGVTCIYITHKLEEFFQITDTITVLRDGHMIETVATKDISIEKLIALMVGREMTERFPSRKVSLGDVVMQIKDVRIEDEYSQEKLSTKNARFELRSGEILGIAGLMGSGRTELVTGLFGEYGKIVDGTCRIQGKPVTIRSARDAMQYGIFLVPENRKEQGLILIQSIVRNISLANLDRFSALLRINTTHELYESENYAKKLQVKAPTLFSIVNNLSGGNQQKVVIAKALMSKPSVLILDDPTRGIDVGAKYEIYKLMNELAKEGVAIIMISSSLEEVLGMSDTILIIHEGETVGLLPREEATQETIMKYATGFSRRNIEV